MGPTKSENHSNLNRNYEISLYALPHDL